MRHGRATGGRIGSRVVLLIGPPIPHPSLTLPTHRRHRRDGSGHRWRCRRHTQDPDDESLVEKRETKTETRPKERNWECLWRHDEEREKVNWISKYFTLRKGTKRLKTDLSLAYALRERRESRHRGSVEIITGMEIPRPCGRSQGRGSSCGPSPGPVRRKRETGKRTPGGRNGYNPDGECH